MKTEPEAYRPVKVGLKLMPFELAGERRYLEGYGIKERALEVEEVRPISGNIIYKALPDTPENRKIAGFRIRWIRGLPGEMFLPYYQIETIEWKDPITKDDAEKVEKEVQERQKDAIAADAKRIAALEEMWKQMAAQAPVAATVEEQKPDLSTAKGFPNLKKFPPEKGWGELRWREISIKRNRRSPALSEPEHGFLIVIDQWRTEKEEWDTQVSRWEADQAAKKKEAAEKKAADETGEKKPDETKEPEKAPEPPKEAPPEAKPPAEEPANE
ncbi:MAG: hypothetical protein AAB215_06045 [Planctomycetota bacterium]